jgi:hypothetical protein
MLEAAVRLDLTFPQGRRRKMTRPPRSVRRLLPLAALPLLLGLAGCYGAPGVYAYPPTPAPPPGAPAGSVVAVPYSATCYAGAYTCSMPSSAPIGSGCTCAGLGAPSYGTVR